MLLPFATSLFSLRFIVLELTFNTLLYLRVKSQEKCWPRFLDLTIMTDTPTRVKQVKQTTMTLAWEVAYYNGRIVEDTGSKSVEQ